MTLTLELPPELEQQLVEAAARQGQPVEAYIPALLAEALAAAPAGRELTPEERRDAVPEYAGLPRRSAEDVAELARRQGAPLVVDLDSLPRDPCPEEDSCDEFLEWLREVRSDARERDWPDES